MQLYFSQHKVLLICLCLLACILLTVGANILVITKNGKPVPVPEISRKTNIAGSGRTLSYVVLGDSTAVGQGGEYNKGLAVSTAEYIAKKDFTVSMQNFAISGARTKDVLNKQLASATKLRPDVVLLSMGANDVTHLTRLADVKRDTRAIIDMLQTANPSVKIIMTGSPEMGSVPRFPQPTKFLAGQRTAVINEAFDEIVQEKGIIRAHIAEETGPIFKKHPELFAQDKFHPTNEGYAVWLPVLYKALNEVIAGH